MQATDALNHPAADGLLEIAKNMVAPYINNNKTIPNRANIRFIDKNSFFGEHNTDFFRRITHFIVTSKEKCCKMYGIMVKCSLTR